MELDGRPLLLSPVLPRLPGSAQVPSSEAEPPLSASDFALRPPPLECKPLPAEVQRRLACGEGLLAALAAYAKHSQLAWCQQQAEHEWQRAERGQQAAAQPVPQQQEKQQQPGAAKEDAAPAGFPEAECGGEDVYMLDAGEGSQTLAPLPPPPAAPEGAAAAELAKAATQPRAAGQPERAAATRRQAACQAQAGAEGLPAAAAPIESPAAQPLDVSGAALAACTPAAAGKAQGGAAAAAVAMAVAEEPASEAEEQEGEGGSEGGRGRKRPLSAQEAATEAALQKIGQASWEALCEELRQRAQQAGEASGRGGRGRGRRGGRKGGRKGGRGGAAAQQAIRLTDVLNPNSTAYHAEFAAAYQKARDELAKSDAKRLRLEALKEHSKLVRRWSDLTAKEHDWFLRHQGQALVGSEAQRMSILQGRVAAEQQRYWQDVQQRAAGGTAAQRYQHATARQLAQLEDDEAQRRQRVTRHQPRFFHLRTVLPVGTAPAAPPVEGQPAEPPPPQLRHVALLRRDGQAPLFTVPPSGAKLHGDRRYLPCCVPAGAAGTAGAAPTLAYRKAAVPPLAEDALLLAVAPQALVQQPPPQQEHKREPGHVKQQDQSKQQAQEQAQQQQQQQEQQAQAQGPPAAASSQEQQAQQQAQPLFCLAASAFAAAVSTPMLQRRPAWEIPITVQQLPAGGGRQEGDRAGMRVSGGTSSSGSTLVCIDKPLQQRVLTMRAKQQRLQKYAVLSLTAGSQEPRHGQDGAQQAEQGAGQGGAQTRHSARSTRSAAPTARPAAAEGPEAPQPAGASSAAPALPPREASYDCWQLGDCRLLLRSHGRLLHAKAPTEGGSKQPGTEAAGQQDGEQAGQAEQGEEEAQQTQAPEHVLLGLKTEYLPEEESEEFTVDELCRWWLRLHICPTADALLAAHVHVPHSKLLSCQTLTAADLELHCSGGSEEDGGEAASRHMRRLAGAGLALLHQLLGALGALGPGRYLLAHAPGEPTCCLFKALSEEAAEAVEGQPPPLPCSATLAQPGTIYDLHAAHQRSGATDTETPCFVPPRWRPFHPDIPQIPYTFPPSGLGLGQLGKQQRYKQRQRKVLPHAWKVLGEGGDFDQVHHVAQISRADYMAGLEEELE
ncbi:hypothetical protein ABPG77_000405 [Micractinium sp. CCAP 211/92]